MAMIQDDGAEAHDCIHPRPDARETRDWGEMQEARREASALARLVELPARSRVAAPRP
jgi:hypothetical protein